jgi:hypothetical protein
MLNNLPVADNLPAVNYLLAAKESLGDFWPVPQD